MTSIQALFSRVPISLFDLQLIENRFLFSPARLKRGHIPGWPGWWWSRQGALVTDGLDNGTPSPSSQASKPPVPNHPHHRPPDDLLANRLQIMWPRNIAIHIVVFKTIRVTCDVSDRWWKKWQKNESFLLNSVSGWENVYHWRTFDILWHFVGFKRRKPEERELLRPGDALYDNYHFIPNTSLTYQKYRVYNISY